MSNFQSLKTIETLSPVTCIKRAGSRLVCGLADGTVQVLDLNSFEWVASVQAHAFAINDIQLDSFDDYIFTCSDDGHIKIWDCSLALCADLIGHSDYIQKLAIDPKNLLLLSGGQDCSVFIWDIRNLVNINPFYHIHQESITSLDFSPDSSVFITGSLDGTMHLWDSVSLNSIKTLSKSRKAPIASASFVSDGKYILNSCMDRHIYLWEVERLKSVPIRQYAGHYNVNYRCQSWLDDNWWLWSTSEDGCLYQWDLNRSFPERIIPLCDDDADSKNFIHTLSLQDSLIAFADVNFKKGSIGSLRVGTLNLPT